MRSSSEDRAARWIATIGGLGDLLPAPGTTAGSLPAAVIWWALAATVGGSRQLLGITAALTVAAVAAGLWASDVEARRRDAEDPRPIVIDEVAGQWLCYLVALPFAPITGRWMLILFTAAGFLLFRLFDVWKPWPVRRFEEIPGGMGIVADDLAAAIYAGVILAIGWNLSGIIILR